MITEVTELISTAARFVNSTSSHIFLTGKAGTGKTTFLKNLADSTHKKYVIVAPTGIAALNAGGVTIHSQFMLPFGTFLPDRNPTGEFTNFSNVYTQNTLARKHPLNSMRKQVLRDIDLLIIDEVSMLRADVLDAIDYRMRAAKGNYHQSFGGVQVLLIGDLFQLPPIVKGDEENYMKRYYNSAWFFEAKALESDGFVYIELDKIFRQQDEKFIHILNNLRNNITTTEDITELNTHYKTPAEIKDIEDVITVSTHNYRTEELNKLALQQLPEPSKFFKAEIEDEFPESMYPVLENLELKVGAQIMFIKNDTDGGAYFNGKLARVVKMVSTDVIVELAGSKIHYTIKHETWENKKYTVNSSTRELDEEIIGTFKQYPIKLAWAITVHKSQGLTFEKAIIDVGQAFAAGQVYVALSRLKSLDGLILRTRIDPNVIATDHQVVQFSKRKDVQRELQTMLKEKQQTFLRQLLTRTFDFADISKEISYVMKDDDSTNEFEDESMRSAMQVLSQNISKENENTHKFRYQIAALLNTNQHSQLLERIQKGSNYYKKFIQQQLRHLLQHLEEVKGFSGTKGYLTHLIGLDLVMTKRLEEIEKSSYIAECILGGKEIERLVKNEEQRRTERAKMLTEIFAHVEAHPKEGMNKSGRKRKERGERKSKKSKAGKPTTYDETIALHKEGLTIKEIAEKRTLSVGTIEGHFARFIASGEIDILKVMDEESLNLIRKTFDEFPDGTSGHVFNKLGGKFGYGQLKMVQAWMESVATQTL
ncbi:MAG: helix-turn-helix domain-containing protein [Flavobacteriales bacterium]|nr:helix-turn-helix domain-containing protein [Flavobacteriales bacterium]